MEIQLDIVQLIWALGLMAIAIGLSALEKLGLEWRLLLATGRAILQLVGVGFFLAVVFEWKNPLVVLGVILLMLTTTAILTRNRIAQKMPHLLPIVWGSFLVSTILTLSYVVLLVVRPSNWYEPQYIIPFAAIILGNAMNGAAIAGERLVSNLNAKRLEIETYLSLGATPAQAVESDRKAAIRAGMIPTINSIAIAALVTLPDFLTGQLLGGTSPFTAAFYQIVILFAIATSTFISTLLIVKGICFKIFNSAAQLVIW
jgi:putative ABC transport system permease protein